MKRLLESDIELSPKSKALLDKVTDKYVNAMTMADKFMQHVRDLYDREAMYTSTDSCHMRLENPPLLFDWINAGISGKTGDIWLILGSTSGLYSFFQYIGTDGKIWKLDDADRAHCHELLTEYFVKNPNTDLLIDTWGEDGPILGGKIGASTNFEWIENEPESRDVGSDDDSEDDEEIEEIAHREIDNEENCESILYSDDPPREL